MSGLLFKPTENFSIAINSEQVLGQIYTYYICPLKFSFGAPAIYSVSGQNAQIIIIIKVRPIQIP